MIKYFLTDSSGANAIDAGSGTTLGRFASYSNSSEDKRFDRTEDPNKAELILFVENHADSPDGSDSVRRVVTSELFKRFPKKCAVHSGKDFPTPIIPGVFPSLPRAWSKIVPCHSGPYLAAVNPYLSFATELSEPSFLAGFTGACRNKPIRIKLRQLAQQHKWANIQVKDTSKEFIATLRSGDSKGHAELKQSFVEDIRNCKFSLCPAGTGASSFRIFESMQMGRALVILADKWLPPPGPRWSDFAIFVRERDLSQLPSILKKRESDWRSMGDHARSAWEEFYSQERIAGTVIGSAFDSLRRWHANPVRFGVASRLLALYRDFVVIRLHRLRIRLASK